MMRDKQYQLLGTRRFLPLFLTQLSQAFNDMLFTAAVAIMIAYRLLSQTDMSDLMVGLTAAVYILPFIIFSATAGDLADKFDKAYLTRAIKAIEIPILLVGLFGLYSQSMILMFTTLFLLGTHSAFFGPIKYAILPEHLQEHELIGANALLEASTIVAILAGTVTGNALILSTHGLAWVSSIAIGISIFSLIVSTFIPRTQPAAPDLELSGNLLGETIKVVKHAKLNRDIFLAILGISWFWLIGTIFKTHFVTFTRDILAAKPSVESIFISVFTVGSALGSLLCSWLLQNRITSKYVPIGIFGMSLFIFDLCFSSNRLPNIGSTEFVGIAGFFSHLMSYHLLLDIFGLGVCAGLYVVPLYAIMQTRTEVQHRARTIAANNVVNSIFMVGSALVAMALLGMHLSILHVFFIVGLFNTAAAAYICKLLPETSVKAFANWLLRTLYKVEVHGIENYHAAGDRILIVSNHTSLLDIILLSAFLPDKFTIAVNNELYRRWWIKPFIALVDSFPIDPASTVATKQIIRVINAGKKCIIFPEGRLTSTGTPMKVYEAPGMIADKTNATIVPIQIEGAQYTHFSRLRGKVRMRWFPKITLTVLPPISLEQFAHGSARQRRRQLGSKLYTLMSDMMFASMMKHQPLFQSLLDTRTVYGGRWEIAEDVQRKPMTYNQLVMGSFILGASIAKRTKFQERVGVLLPTSNTGVVAFFAMHAYGRIPAMLNFSSGSSNLISACQTGEIKTIYTAHKFIQMAKLEELMDALKSANLEIVYLEEFRESLTLSEKIIGFVKSRFSDIAFANMRAQINSGSPAALLFTSGSEGKPKGVLLSHDNMHANCYQLHARVDFTPKDIMFSALPIFHSFGLTAGVVLPMLSGIRTFYYPNPLHYRIVPELVYDTNATIMFGTDTFLTGYARYAHPYDFYSIRYIFAGAEKLKPETVQMYAEKFGVRVFEGYGATETSPVVSTNTPMQNKLGTVGCLLPGLQYRITPVEGIHGGGRLILKGPNVMIGYLRADHPGEIQPPPDGWYDTGDIVDIDKDGYIHIKGRAKRFAKIGGEMVSLTAVEGYVSSLWPNYHHAVISVPDAKKGEQLVLLTDYEPANREALVSYVRKEGFSELSIPRQILITATVPVLATGKIDYKSVEVVVDEMTRSDERVVESV